MVRKGILAVFEGSGISPWSERDIWPNLKVEITPKLGKQCPPNFMGIAYN